MIQYKKELVLSGGNYMRQRHRHWKRSQEKLRWFVTYKMLKGNSSKTKSLGKYFARFLLLSDEKQSFEYGCNTYKSKLLKKPMKQPQICKSFINEVKQ